MTEPNNEELAAAERPTTSEPPEPPGSPRRRFCKLCLGGMGVATGGFVVAPIAAFLQPPHKLTMEGRAEVPLAELAGGQAIYREVRGIPVVIVPRPEAPLVLNAACTHLGCIVRWEHETETFICPCHGAVFDITGAPLKGPTNEPLAPVTYEIKDGKILIG